MAKRTFLAGEFVHPIQASHAMREPETWIDGRLESFSPRRITVDFDDGSRRHYRTRTEELAIAMRLGAVPGRPADCLVGVSERWSLAAVGRGPAPPRSSDAVRLRRGSAVEAIGDPGGPVVLLSVAPIH